jgi:hypothetical protein
MMSSLALVLACSMPADVEPVKWNMHVEVPVLRDSWKIAGDLHLGDEARQDGFDDDRMGDTIGVSIGDSLSMDITQNLMTLETSSVEQEMGTQTLQKTTTVDHLFELSEKVTIPAGFDQLPADAPFEDTTVEDLEGIQAVTFHESSPQLRVNVTNNSAAASLSDLVLTLVCDDEQFSQSTVGLVEAGETEVVSIPVAGKSLTNPLTIRVAATVDKGSKIAAGEGLLVSLNLDDMVVAAASLADSLIDYRDIFEGRLALTDSIRIHYLDLSDAVLEYEVVNPSGLQVAITGDMHHLWSRRFAVENEMVVLEDAGGLDANDSASYRGIILDDTLCEEIGTDTETGEFTLSDVRLLTEWNEDSLTSEIPYVYTLATVHDGRMVHFDHEDTLEFSLRPIRFPFITVSATLEKEIAFEQEPQVQQLPFQWEESIRRGLRESFRFGTAQLTLDVGYRLGGGSSLSDLKVAFSAENRAAGGVRIQENEKMEDIEAESVQRLSFDIVDIINEWPDSIAFASSASIPHGTRLVLNNAKDEGGRYKDNLEMGVDVAYALSLPFVWEVTDSFSMVLENSRLKIPADELATIRKMRDRTVTLNLAVINNTNVSCTLFGLAAPDADEDRLLSLADKDIAPAILSKKQGKPFFGLLGKTGLTLPPRGEKTTQSIVIDNDATEKLLAGDRCHVRWRLSMPASEMDAMTDTAGLHIELSAEVEGIAVSDSLMTWE